MSNYINFIKDFPSRCKDMLLLAHEKAVSNDREVTLSLMVASAGFLIPFERLRNDGLYIQPTQDRSTHPVAARNFDKLLSQAWSDSTFNKDKGRSWSSGGLVDPQLPIDQWAELRDRKQVEPKTTVGEIVTIMRHALAHGNIFTLPTSNNKIDAVIFVSGGVNRRSDKLVPYQYVYVTPNDFRQFLLAWFGELSSWDLTQEEILEALERAA